MDEIRMVQGCIDGDAVAQRALYDLYSRKMMGVCLRYTRYPEDAQDILQDGFVKVFTKIEMYSGKGSLEGWVRRIIVNTALEWLRKNKIAMNSLEADELHVAHVSFDNVSDESHTDDLLQLIQKLPAGYRTVFNLYAIDGYTHKEIAEQLEISEGTSKSQFSRARTLIQKMLEGENVR